MDECRSARISVGNVGGLAVARQDDEFLTLKEDVSVSVGIGDLVLQKLDASGGYLGCDVEKMIEGLPYVAGTAKDVFYCGYIPGETAVPIEHGQAMDVDEMEEKLELEGIELDVVDEGMAADGVGHVICDMVREAMHHDATAGEEEVPVLDLVEERLNAMTKSGEVQGLSSDDYPLIVWVEEDPGLALLVPSQGGGVLLKLKKHIKGGGASEGQDLAVNGYDSSKIGGMRRG